MTFQLSWHHSSDAASPNRGFRELKLGDSVTVGREAGVDILLQDISVSRLHAEIWVDGAGVHFKDRGSANGVQLEGSRVAEGNWLPGQKLRLGPFVIELAARAVSETPMLDHSSRVHPGHAVPSARLEEPALGGRIKLGDVYRRAKQNDKQAVHDMFQGFLGRSEQVIDCGYLGCLGIIFPEHCFWCVTDTRVCGLMVNYAGWVRFQFGFIKSLNRATFNQPSLVVLWAIVIFWLLMCAVVLFGAITTLFSGYFISGLLSLLATAGLLVLTPAVVWLYYRFEKAGCVFWTLELVPIWIFSDRHNILSAQRFMSVFTDQKRALGD